MKVITHETGYEHLADVKVRLIHAIDGLYDQLTDEENIRIKIQDRKTCGAWQSDHIRKVRLRIFDELNEYSYATRRARDWQHHTFILGKYYIHREWCEPLSFKIYTTLEKNKEINLCLEKEQWFLNNYFCFHDRRWPDPTEKK